MRSARATCCAFALALTLAGGGAGATTMSTIDRICPVGGATYESFQINSTTRFGTRLDMRPTGPAASIPWIECPNGFVVYKDEKEFTAAEIATLTPVVASEAYRQLRRDHVTAYRVVHLRRALGAADGELAWLLLKAAWEAEDDGKDVLRQSYLAEALTAFETQAATAVAGSEEWWGARIVVAEVERQQSRFTESMAALDALPIDQLAADDIRRRVIKQIRDRSAQGDSQPADIQR